MAEWRHGILSFGSRKLEGAGKLDETGEQSSGEETERPSGSNLRGGAE